MNTRRIRGAPAALAMLSFLVLALGAPARAADTSAGDDTANGWHKVLAYARCAFNVFRATDPGSWGVAFFDCARTYESEPPIPHGGGL